MKNKINIYDTIPIILCLINILNLFIPRYATEENFIFRLPVQILNGVILVLAIYLAAFYQASLSRRYLYIIHIFISLIIAYWIYAYAYLNVPNGIMSSVLRLISWLACIPFFSKYLKVNNNKKNILIQAFVITFILSAGKKIFESAKFQAEDLSGGDIAGLTLVLALPVIFIYFKGNFKIIISLITIMLIMVTLRRTAIISLAFSVPFLIKDIRQTLRPIHIFYFFTLLLISSFTIWIYFGDAITHRFENLLSGDGAYQTESYGSGRSVFYAIVYNNWADSSWMNFLFGNGIGAVSDLLRREYYDIKHAHNDILEILYTFGLFGFFVWFYFLYQLLKIRKSVKRYSADKVNIYYVSIISFLIVSLTSGSFYRVEMIIFSIGISSIIGDIDAKRSHLKKQKALNELSKLTKTYS